MACEDYPCCGHEAGDCPRIDAKGRERWTCVECGKLLPLSASSSKRPGVGVEYCAIHASVAAASASVSVPPPNRASIRIQPELCISRLRRAETILPLTVK